MQASLSSTHPFLPQTTSRDLHRKQKSESYMSGTPSRLKVDSWSAATVWNNARDAYFAETASEKEIVTSQHSGGMSFGNSDETMKEMVTAETIYQGLTDYTIDLDTSKSPLIDDDYLQRAFGITMRSSGFMDGRHKEVVVPDEELMESNSRENVYEMEASQPAVKGRKELHVAIPAKRTSPSPSRSRSPTPGKSTTQTPVSNLSTPMTAPYNKHLHSVASQSRGSIVSPLSAVSKPKRPFSSLMIHGGAKEAKGAKPTTPQIIQSANSLSSDEISEQDGKSSGYSPRSSMSSVNSDAVTIVKAQEARRPQTAETVSVRFDSTSLYHAALAPKPPKNAKSATSLATSPSKSIMKRQSSFTSLRSVKLVNVNKPLPREPGQLDDPNAEHKNKAHSRSVSRSSSITVRQNSFSQEKDNETKSSSGKSQNQSRKDSLGTGSRVSLRSKYTPKDLDALDDAFQNTTIRKPSSQLTTHASPSLASLIQIPLTLDDRLDTIKEDSPRDSRVPFFNDPLQISRGPMRMEPSRRPPPPPQIPHNLSSASLIQTEHKRQLMKRSQSSQHIGSQLVPDQAVQRRASTMITGGSNKAYRILGQSGSTALVRQPSVEQWTVSESPDAFTESGSRDVSDSELEHEGTRDAHFEEIRKRLELLSPKDDPTVTFLANHLRNTARSTEKLRLSETLSPEFAPKKEQVRNPPLHIAELEAQRVPSPVEIGGIEINAPIELPLPSPAPFARIPIPVEPATVAERRGRKEEVNPHSTASSNSKSLHSTRSFKVRSLASLAASEIPDIYAGLPSPPGTSSRPSMTLEDVEQLISADSAEQVLLRILENLGSLEDLFHAARVSRGFYRTFKRHELALLKKSLWQMSPAAWELREMSIPYSELPAGAKDYTPNLYFRHYVQDLFTMVELKALILDSCTSFLRASTISALAGETERSPIIDEAFWRVWSFCRIFGCGNSREDDIVGQMDWLKGGLLARQSTDTRTLALSDELARNSVLFNPPHGFSRGNEGGLTEAELIDMNEIWTCLGVLVRGYHGKRKEAREYGIFNGIPLTPGDTAKEDTILEEWTFYLLTLGPDSILDATSPTRPTQTTFAHVQAQGYTTWTPPMQGLSRSTFLKEAVSRVYQEKVEARQRPSQSSSPKSFTTHQSKPASPAVGPPASPDPSVLLSRQRVKAHAAELRAKKQDPTYKDVPVSEERPMSDYKNVLERLEALSTSNGATDAPPVPRVPGGFAARLSRRMPKVTLTSPNKSKSKIFSSPNPSVSSLPSSIKEGSTPPSSSHGVGSNGGRLASLRGKFTGRPATPKTKSTRPSTPLRYSEDSNEKESVVPDQQPTIMARRPQVRDPVDLAMERLVAMGFDEQKAKKALAQTDSGNGIDFDRALTKLVKDKKRAERLERLNKMG